MRQVIKQTIADACKHLYKTDVSFELSRTDEKFGDFATNVALIIAAQEKIKPGEVANKLLPELNKKLESSVEKITIAGPGFINFKLSSKTLLSEISSVDEKYGKNKIHDNKTIVAEYSDPNPFKVLHAGHLYTSIVGDAIANLLENSGAKVHRVNFGGDIGLHVAKTMWSIIKNLGGEEPAKLKNIKEKDRTEWLTKAYIDGNNAYDDNESAKIGITELNTRLYEIHKNNDTKSPLAEIYWTTRKWSYDYFEEFYSKIGSKFDKYYPESTVSDLGLKTVLEQQKKGIFKESKGAIVFEGHKHGLHTRVFINSAGLPTYEAKDIGLILQKNIDYKFDTSLVITGNEQAQYMQVILKSLEQFKPELAKKTIHLTHGMVKLSGGVKMSSRKGNILRAVEVLDFAESANKKLNNKDQPEVVLGAVKYAFIKQGLGADIIYSPDESVAITGNSGPYLQYSFARAKSIISKSVEKTDELEYLDEAERSLARKISEYPEVTENAVKDLEPHQIATYLYELASCFNGFYEANRVIGDSRESIRLILLSAYANVLKNGLAILGIEAPDKI